jgi:adenosylmethionine-8-amino-7-oxononanoate aminotransferase
MTRQNIYDAFYDDDISRAFLHSHSYTGSALACRAAIATLDIFKNDNFIVKNKILSSKIDHAFAWAKESENLEHIRQCGTIFAFDIKEDCLPPNFSKTFFKIALDQEVLVRPIGKTIYIMPPYIITDEELQILSKGIKHTLNLVLAKSA